AAHDPLIALVLGIEDAQRVDLEPRQRILGELAAEALEVGDEQAAIGRAAGGVADRVQLQLEPAEQAELAEPGGLERDDLGVDGGVVGSQGLHTELNVLAIEAPA